LCQNTKGNDPDIDEQKPEFIFESRSVFQNKEIYVVNDCDGIADHDGLKVNDLLEGKLSETQGFWQRSNSESANFKRPTIKKNLKAEFSECDRQNLTTKSG
jgi:hypothetical protein